MLEQEVEYMRAHFTTLFAAWLKSATSAGVVAQS